MKDSIIVNMEYAGYDIITGTPFVERHHVFGGANRKKSDDDGLWIPLTPEHHTGRNGVHNNKEMQALTHIIGQLAWELEQVSNGITKSDAREMFRERYGKSYL